MTTTMKVVMRQGEKVHLKQCIACLTWKVATTNSTSPLKSEFYVSWRHKGSTYFKARCISCHRARENERLADPDQRAVAAEYTRRWRKRRKAEDPRYFADRDMIRRREIAEREGRTVRNFKPRVKRELYAANPEVPSLPFSQWLAAYMRRRGMESAAELAHDLGLNERRTWSLLHARQPFVRLTTVDRALGNAACEVEIDGRLIFTLEDLYPMQEAAA